MSEDLISRQAAIDALGEEPEVWSEKDQYELGLNNQWNDDIDALKAVPSAQPKQRWIPVTEGLPNPYQQCWFTTTDGEVIQHHFDGLVSHYKAWMPFEKPEPWKGEGDESDKD